MTVLEIIGRESTVKATTGDSRLGGQDLDKAFMENIIERIKEERGEWEPSTKDKSKIRKACKEAKILLSNTYSTFVNVEIGDEDYQYEVSKNEFEEICEPSFKKLMPCVQKALENA